MFKGVHLSDTLLNVGDIITSKQSIEVMFPVLYDNYKKIANELNIYYPINFGYAYSIDKSYNADLFNHTYIVEAPIDCVTKGDYRFSIQLLAENSFFSPISLNYALKNPIKFSEHIKHYFDCIDSNYIEYISDAFEIIEIIK